MKRKLVISILAFCILLTGCSGLKNIQDLNYIVAIGLDYDAEKGEYKAYLQALNFANVAKIEAGRPTEKVPAFVASATGETLNLAVRKLYKTSEPPLFFGHVITYVISNKLVTHKFNEVVPEIGRNRSLRHTLRLVVTEDNMNDIFNTQALFQYPEV
ncbi:Ger(x)C family spore germination protein, partial [Neobacillus drentensis]